MPNEPVTPERPSAAPAEAPGLDGAIAMPLGDAEAHSSGLTIIASKISPADQGRSVLTRSRLVGWFEQQRKARLILVSAEAGYGKSTLLSDHAWQSDTKCIWYRIETSDGDWITFLSYMVAALREVSPGFGRSTEALLRHVAAMGSTREVVLAQFLADLGSVESGDLDVILDDYHLVDNSDDVRMIVSRLLERAPEGMRFILAGRGRPKLALGRLLAQGRVSELTIDDLRFTKPEIHELFAATYHQPLDDHACDIVAERTEGWAASLQLVSASIAVSRPSEVAAFIEALSGATGPIYDFLAEEVLTRLSPQTQRVLIHASLIDRLRPELVTAALSVSRHAPGPEAVGKALDDAEALGLLGDHGGSAGGRIHPLFRQFLAHHLELEASARQIRSMHLAIAATAEPTDWLVAAKHFAMGGEPDESMRVLGSAASEALGTGAWGAAVEIVDLMPDTTPPPSVEVIKARALVSDGRPDDALSLLAAMDPEDLGSDDRALLSLARASALQMGGRSHELWREVETLHSTHHSEPVVNRLADAWALMGTACGGGSISDARRSLDQLAHESAAHGLGHFEGIALHNSATAALAQGDYSDAVKLAAKARSTLVGSPPDASIRPSTLMTQALATAESDVLADGLALAEKASAAKDAHPDVIADAAYLSAIGGDGEGANLLELRLRRVMAGGPTPVGTPHQAAVVRVTNLITSGLYREALAEAAGFASESPDELDGLSRGAYLRALAATLSEATSAREDVRTALAIAERQQAWRWDLRLRMLDASLREDGAALSRWVAECAKVSRLANLELADLIGASLHLVDPLPPVLAQSIARHPARWRPVLLRRLDREKHPSAAVAARLLAEYGTKEDAELLAAFERRAMTSARKPHLSRSLIRRVSPTLRVHDLGRTTYEVSSIEVRASAARRKALSLVLYLVTRPRQTATREQVMEELWPNQGPSSATNSLHQTLHFVRRDIAPWSGEGISADYVPLDSELVYLDPELVQVDSVAFMRQSAEALSSSNIARVGPSIAKLYTGRFAPEFEYEDWAEDWRTLLHAQFLHLSQATASALLEAQRTQLAIEVLSRAIEVDGLAFELRATLIRSLVRVGAADAAGDHYRQYTNLMRRELEVSAPPMQQLLQSSGDEPVE